MKQNKEEALRWLDQAKHNYEVAKNNFNAGFYSDACFMADQTAQIAFKAVVIYYIRKICIRAFHPRACENML